jgi:hypothetical protein
VQVQVISVVVFRVPSVSSVHFLRKPTVKFCWSFIPVGSASPLRLVVKYRIFIGYSSLRCRLQQLMRSRANIQNSSTSSTTFEWVEWSTKYIKNDVDKLRTSKVPRLPKGYQFVRSKNNFSEPSKIVRIFFCGNSRRIVHKIHRVSFISVERSVPVRFFDQPSLPVPAVLPITRGLFGLPAPVFNYPPKRIRTSKYSVPRGILKIPTTSSL